MKQHIKISVATIVILTLASCSKEPKEAAVGSPVELEVEARFDLTTDKDEKAVSWENGDRLSLLRESENYLISCDAEGPVATFKGKAVQLPSGERYIAVFPGDESIRMENRSFDIELPRTIDLVPGHLTRCVGTGYVNDSKAVLNHATGYLSFTISRDDISSLIISTSDGKPLSGRFKLNIGTDGKASMKAYEAGCSDRIIVSTGAIAGKYYLPLPPNNYNGFTISLSSSEGTAEKKFEKYPRISGGKIEDLGAIDSEIVWESFTKPEMELIRASSSTIAVRWSTTNFISPATDLISDWSVGIYNDENGSDLRVSWDIPSSLFTSPEGSILGIEGPWCPRFIFSGLEAAHSYYVKAWHTAHPECASEMLCVKTLPYENISMPEGPAQEGDVILSEDFSELVWGGDISARVWSYSDDNMASAEHFHSATGNNPVGERTIGGFTHKFKLVQPGNEAGVFSTMGKAVANSRLKGWASISEDESKSRVCGRPGYVKLGGGNRQGGIVTPVLSAIEDKARVKISFKAHPYRELANDGAAIKVMAITTPEGSLKGDGTYTNNYVTGDSRMISLGDRQEWQEYECELTVSGSEKIAIYSQRLPEQTSGQCRVLVDEIRIEVLEKLSSSKPAAIASAADLQSFLSFCEEYEKDEIVKMVSDIDLNGVELTGGTSFNGILDGDGHSLKNWKSDGVALLKNLWGTVRNLTIDASCSITPAINGDFGALAAFVEASGLVENCTNNADIELECASFDGTRIGGLVGRMDGKLVNCINNGNISIHQSGDAAGNVYFGGVLGLIRGGSGKTCLEGCRNNGNISYTVDGKSKYVFIGGVSAGTATNAITEAFTTVNANIENCTNTGNISYVLKNGGSLSEGAGIAGSGNYTNIGGVVAYWEGSITNCVNGVTGNSSKGKVTLTVPTSNSANAMSRPAVGGVCAFALFSVEGCSNYGKIQVKGSFANSGSLVAGTGIFKGVSIAGVVGQAGPLGSASSYCVKDCHNYGPVETDLWQNASSSTESRIGGVAGYALAPVSACSNEAAINIKSRSKSNSAGGVVGYVGQGADNLQNSGSLTLTIPEQKAKAYAGGAVGLSSASGKFTNLKNEAQVKLIIEATTIGEFSYLGGCCASDAQGPGYSNCENYGDLIYEGAAKIRIGGITPYTNQNSSKLKSVCNISAKCSGKDYCEVGGVIAYTAATGFDSWSFEGSIDTSGSTKKVYTGGLLGKSNGNAKFNGCSFKGKLTTASGNNAPGLYVGGLQSNGLAFSFGDTAKCVVGAGSQLNGTAVTEPTAGNLVSQSSNDGSFTCTSSLINIIIE